MAARKTMAVAEILKKTNQMLAESTCSPEVREGMIAVLENILHATGNYKGFGYLLHSQVPLNEKPGIVRNAYGVNHHEFPDETRRVYYS